MFVIDAAKRVHRGLTEVQRRMAPPSATLLELMMTMWRPYALNVVAHLGVADHLAAGTRSIEDLARATETDTDALYRVMRALARDGIFAEPEPRRFALTSLSEPLKSDHPTSMRNTIRQSLSEWNHRIWARLEDAVRTGEPQFEKEYGSDIWKYFESHPEQASHFHESMDELTRMTGPLVAAVYDFSKHRTLVDVGGGRARLLSLLLGMYPNLRGINYDLEVAVSEAPKTLRDAGVESRCEIITGSFMESVPKGYDVYLLKHIVHGMKPDEMDTLFGNLREAIEPGKTLLLVEMLVPEHGAAGTHPSHLDLQMLVGSGGKERTASEYSELLDRYGFRMADVHRTPSPVSVIVSTRR